jgi:hypothetical protein
MPDMNRIKKDSVELVDLYVSSRPDFLAKNYKIHLGLYRQFGSTLLTSARGTKHSRIG